MSSTSKDGTPNMEFKHSEPSVETRRNHDEEVGEVQDNTQGHLKRDLKNRHMQMIAIGTPLKCTL